MDDGFTRDAQVVPFGRKAQEAAAPALLTRARLKKLHDLIDEIDKARTSQGAVESAILHGRTELRCVGCTGVDIWIPIAKVKAIVDEQVSDLLRQGQEAGLDV